MEHKSENRICQNCKNDFTIEPDDFGFYEKIKVPPPTFCPECRNQRRMSWRNERSLHRVKCAAPGHNEEIISMYDPEESLVVFDNEYWWSDKWDAFDYGLVYDFSVPFFTQFSKLLHNVPLVALSVINSVNCEYTNYMDGNKNCYLVFGSGWNENVRYGNKLMQCKDSQDLFMCTKCELSYECEGCFDSYKLFWSRNSKNCTDSYFLYNCRNCTDCFGCANLVSKSYCIWNKQYSREEYLIIIETFKMDSYQDFTSIQNRFLQEIYMPSIHRFANIFSSANCTGDNINNSKSCLYCFDLFMEAENSKFLYSALYLKDTYDGNGIFKNELSCELVDANHGSRNFSGITLYNSEDTSYCLNCHNIKHCFGCIGLRKKQYCILNKQYTKAEYERLLPKIIEHMNDTPYVDKKGIVYKYGEFFPTELSPFSYNETIAQEYFPLTAEEAGGKGYVWKNTEKRNYTIDITTEEIPNSIVDVQEDVVGKVFECSHQGTCKEQCTEAFKITAEEFQFYKRMNFPLPRLCSNCRHFNRLKQRNPLELWRRTCMCDKKHPNHEGKCEVGFETSYAPDRPEIVYCEKCYQQEVY